MYQLAHRVCCTRPIWLDSDVPEAGDPRLIFVASLGDLFFFGGSTSQLKNYQVVSTRMALVAFQTVFVLGFSMQQTSQLLMTIFDNSIDGASTKAIAWPDVFLSGVRKGAAEVEVSRNGTSKQRRKGRGLGRFERSWIVQVFQKIWLYLCWPMVSWFCKSW